MGDNEACMPRMSTTLTLQGMTNPFTTVGLNVSMHACILPLTPAKIGQRVKKKSSKTSVMSNEVERATLREINVGNHGIRDKGKNSRDEAVELIAMHAAERRYRPAYSDPILTNGKGDKEGKTWVVMHKWMYDVGIRTFPWHLTWKLQL